MPKRLVDYQILGIVRLAQAGVSIADIARKSDLRKTTVYYHARNYCRKMTKLDLNFLTETEKGYIVGFFLGDGSFNKGYRTPRYIVRFALDAKRDQDIATRLNQIFEKAHKKVSIFPRENTLTLKVCSKELVEYIQRYIQYEARWNNKKEKRLLGDKDWSPTFQYGILAGIIDSDGHVHRHLGAEIKTVSPSIFKEILNVLNNLGMMVKTQRREATANSYSKKIRYVIYIPSLQMKMHKNKIPSVKIARHL